MIFVIIKSVIFQSEADPFVPPDPQALFALEFSVYSSDENTVTNFKILRTVTTAERMSVDWAITNANVTPSSGTQVFEIGSAEEIIAITNNEVGPTEIGQLTISNPINLDGGEAPALTSPSIATYTVVDLDTPQITWLAGNQQGGDFIDDWELWIGDPVLASASGPRAQMKISSAFCTSSYISTWTKLGYMGGTSGEVSGTPYNFERCLQNLPANIPVVLVMGMVAGESSNRDFNNPAVWDQINNGNYDSYYNNLGQTLRTKLARRGRSPDGDTLIISLGHEMTGDWYEWSIGSKVTEYKSAWVRVTNILRGLMPDVKFEWRPARAKRGFSTSLSYLDIMPDPATIDYLSLSLHDGSGHATTSEQTFIDAHMTPASSIIGHTEAIAACRSLGKPYCLGEWRPQITDCDPGNPYFDPSPRPDLFIKYTYEQIINPNRDIFAYDVYLDSSCGRLSTRWNTTDPRERAAVDMYKTLWRPDAVS